MNVAFLLLQHLARDEDYYWWYFCDSAKGCHVLYVLNLLIVLILSVVWQAKCADLDARLLTLSKELAVVNDKISALQANADVLDPSTKNVDIETVQ